MVLPTIQGVLLTSITYLTFPYRPSQKLTWPAGPLTGAPTHLLPEWFYIRFYQADHQYYHQKLILGHLSLINEDLYLLIFWSEYWFQLHVYYSRAVNTQILPLNNWMTKTDQQLDGNTGMLRWASILTYAELKCSNYLTYCTIHKTFRNIWRWRTHQWGGVMTWPGRCHYLK